MAKEERRAIKKRLLDKKKKLMYQQLAQEESVKQAKRQQLKNGTFEQIGMQVEWIGQQVEAQRLSE